MSTSVLVVDDHQNMVTSLSILLRNAGFQVEEAVGGEASYARLSDEASYDVVVTDLGILEPVDGELTLVAVHPGVDEPEDAGEKEQIEPEGHPAARATIEEKIGQQ